MSWTLWLRFLIRDAAQQQLVLAAVAGVLGAIAAMLFRAAMVGLVCLLPGGVHGLVTAARLLPWWDRVLLPLAGGLAAGMILVIGARLGGRTTTDYMEAAVVGDGRMDVRRTLAKCCSSLASIVSGGSVGREGSMVQLGALLASLQARIMPMPVTSRPLLVACGAAAGMAAVYNAPLAGSVFVAEVVMGTMAIEVLGPLLVASVISSAISRMVFGVQPLYSEHSTQLTSLWQLPIFAALGLAAACAAPFWLGALEGARRMFAQVSGTVWKMGIGGLLVGLISLVAPEVWGNGDTVITDLIQRPAQLMGHGGGTLAELVGQAPIAAMVLLLFIAKLVATAATTGSGAVGGVFTPTLCLGAAIGVFYYQLLQWVGIHFHCEGLQTCMAGTSAACAMIGMGAFLGACTQAPVMAMLMVFEMTLNDSMILPLMLACVVSYSLVLRLGCPALYSMGGKRSERALAKPAWSELRVRDILKPVGPVVTNDAPFTEVASSFASHHFNFIFVQDRAGIYRGAIAIQDIKEYLHDDRLGRVAIAEDLRVPLAALVRDDELPKALEAFARHPGNRLPVVDENARMVGCVHKYDIMLAFANGGIAKPEGAAEAANGA